MKKKLSLLLAFVMVLSLCISSAFAASKPAAYEETQALTAAQIKFITMEASGSDVKKLTETPRNHAEPGEGQAYYTAYLTVRVTWDGVSEGRKLAGGILVFTIKPSTTNDKNPGYPNAKTMKGDLATPWIMIDHGVTTGLVNSNMLDEEAQGIFKLRSGFAPTTDAEIETDEKGNKYYQFEIEVKNLLAKEGDRFPVIVEAFIDDGGMTQANWLPITFTEEAAMVNTIPGEIVIPGTPISTETPADSVAAASFDGEKDKPITAITATRVGGTDGGTWSATGLPEGVTIDPTSGEISGTPVGTTESGTYKVTYTTPGGLATTSPSYNWTVKQPSVVTPSLSYNAKDVNVGATVALDPTLSNIGDGFFNVKDPSKLPKWLTLDPTSGKITGTAPDEEENVEFTVVYSNGTDSVEAPVKFKVVDPNKEINPAPVTAANIRGTVGKAIAPVEAKQSGTAGGTWTLIGTLPKGLEFNNGVISGIPTEKGTFTYKVSYTTPKGTFTDVESPEYTITISDKSDNPYGDDDDFTNTYTLTYETNGGNNIGSERYKKGSVVTLIKVPVRAGYTFDGWFSDADLKNKLEKIEMDGNKTVYAGWKKTETPDVFDNEHFAYIIGYTDGTVRPKNNITRAEVATIFYRLLSEDARNKNKTTTNSFSDVNAGDWFNVEVSTMAKMGVINGYEDGTFRPQENITRAEFAAIASRFDKSNAEVQDADFADIEGHWGKIEISKAAMNGWITGDPTGNFRPNDKLTRAEAMAIINRILNRVITDEAAFLPGMKTWSDNADKTMWYYLDVQEATNGHKHEVDENGVEMWTELLPNRVW